MTTSDGIAPNPKQHRKAPVMRPPAGTPKADLRAAHKAKMARKAAARERFYQLGNEPRRVLRLLGIPAGINRHTMKPHENRASMRKAVS